ncbi:serine protease [Streptomyces sp. NPDC050516]|uniref:serine protease n=1 Tax=Streptomyces sp. NPDC050516 TaxID=3365621 RepID=UPI0037A441E2
MSHCCGGCGNGGCGCHKGRPGRSGPGGGDRERHRGSKRRCPVRRQPADHVPLLRRDLLNPGTVLTAASCVAGIPSTRMKIRYGSLNHGSGGATAQVRQVVIHPDYRAGSHDNDIAVVHTATPVLNITSALLPPPGDDPVPGTVLSTSGWGATSQGGSLPAALRTVDVPVTDRGTCRTAYGTSEAVTEHMLCAGLPQGGKDFCAGDEGGPAVTHNLIDLPVLRALPSWHRGCAQAGCPGVYTRIGSYVPWITTHLAG